MKKLHKLLLIISLLTCTLSVGFVSHRQHVHALTSGDVIGNCPSCHRHTLTFSHYVTEPTCTDPGSAYVQCVGNVTCSYTDRNYELPALGHNYVTTSTEAATCTEDGVRHQRCSRCGATRNRTIEALGHDYKYEELQPTCTEDGFIKGTCSRCGNETNEIIPALGHDFGEFTIVTPAGCEEDGLQEAICSRCNEKKTETIPMTGHDFPEEWTVEKPAGYLTKGLAIKLCRNCGKRLEQIIPAKIKPPILIIVVVTAISAITAGYFALKKVMKAKKSLFKPSFETKTVLVESGNEELVELLKRQVYLSVTGCSAEELLETAKEKGADLVICEIDNRERLDDLLEAAKADFPDSSLGLIVSRELLDLNRDALNEMVSDRTILNYVPKDQGNYSTLVKLVLPALKPDLKSDESLENLGAVADLFGIPGVSSIINVYVSGRDIKSTLEEGELGVSETATIIGDIASILGLDKLGSIAGLVSDVDSIKAALDEETGASEVKDGVDAAIDVKDVISDILDK
ncbi:MAG: hypothetical protein IJM15_00750 [Erysipelotrichaceae bacterium]|nr:hypothetical protein [Erysipelotrichaceae bacterium]